MVAQITAIDTIGEELLGLIVDRLFGIVRYIKGTDLLKDCIFCVNTGSWSESDEDIPVHMTSFGRQGGETWDVEATGVQLLPGGGA
ncbi:hypothetical protein P7K49_014844 [Saguinus oedipus]|uniref:Uncharacterized protein n=1 Tax=Saguinus oedipus TaxID=9490 RepID=A0ABQ9V8D6_SAGOE|nr:hypothetical protein P7K49_014844 [Saguinus oedipus]